MSNYAAIETHYAGCKFRSRLEARWAVFFDTLGIEWQYEPEGFNVPDLAGKTKWRYLPDFWLPKSDTWVEVKGDPNGLSGDYGVMLAHTIDWGATPISSGLLILGDIPDVTGATDVLHSHVRHHKGVLHRYAHFKAPGGIIISDVWFRIIRDGEISSAEDGLPQQTSPKARVLKLTEGTSYWPLDPDVASAYVAARTARFEHGQTPKPHRPTMPDPAPKHLDFDMTARLVAPWVGQMVRHCKWGIGTIVAVPDGGPQGEVIIDFPHVGRKTFLTAWAPLVETTQ